MNLFESVFGELTYLFVDMVDSSDTLSLMGTSRSCYNTLNNQALTNYLYSRNNIIPYFCNEIFNSCLAYTSDVQYGQDISLLIEFLMKTKFFTVGEN